MSDHGGAMSLDSDAGGTTVTFVLPSARGR
jgi:hypothetical protein